MAQPVRYQDILDIAQYEKARETFRAKALAAKEQRRVEVGPHFEFLFENHLTALYQVQEMMRVERMVEQTAIQFEIDTYNDLVPGPGELSATLMIAFPDPEERDIQLKKLLGLEQHVWLEAKGLDPLPARFDTRQIGSDRLSSVQFLKFQLPPALMARWRELAGSGGLRLVVDHPAYRHAAALTPNQAAALAEDFAD
ncbi:MAG: DUF3501 family protein [Deltaproteobacteria bacterium]|nr:DUF3501 family protein [Deltaproteobacteria bacterium]